ncbi:MAG: lysophospholipid acyltransferase family protein [Bacteroidales bacterium]|jgi:1-acyl-sn-glycerol-3-phosphate acyltransferase|nr:lysophospholipid acyltransferase family protein [Bacteroidales bacterium]
MFESYFKGSAYDTPIKEKPTLWDKMLVDSRLYFTLKYAHAVFSTRSEARKGIYDTKAWSDSSFYIFRFIEKTGGVFHLSGLDNIEKPDGPVLFIANHMSTLETMILPCIIAPKKEVTFVVKESLVRHPLFGDVMRSRNPVVVGRKDPRKDLETVMNGGMDLLSKGTSVVIFPQSTRNLEFRPDDFNTLGVKLAKKAGVKVVPVALKTDFWGNGKIIRELGPIDSSKHIYFRFGEPFTVTGNGKAENQLIIDFISRSLEEWKIQDAR